MRVVSPRGVVVNVSDEKAKRLGWPAYVGPSKRAEPKKAKSKK